MNPNEIEKAEYNFITKLHQLRSILTKRQQDNAKKKIRKRLYHLFVLIVVPIFMVGAGFAIILQKPDTRPTTFKKKKPLGNTKPQANQPMRQSRSVVEKKTRTPQTFMNHSIKISKKTPSQNIKSQISLPQKSTLPVVSPLKIGDQKRIDLTSAVACQSVRNHHPLDKKNIFLIKNDRRAYIWMEVRTENPPFVIKHIYYRNGQKHCEVPLNIRYARMRTWSYVTLSEPSQIGSWKVEIAYENRVLKTVNFQVRNE